MSDTNAYYTMQDFCGDILENTIPMYAQLVPNSGKFGFTNLYCRWTAKIPEITESSVSVNYTRLTPSTLVDKIIIETIRSDRRDIYRSTLSNEFVFSAEELEEIIIHYYTMDALEELPFVIDIYAIDKSTTNFLGLFIALGVIILVCIVCSVLFYKCSKVIIENNRRLQETRAIELASINDMNRLTRDDEMKRINKSILDSLYETELKPIPYTLQLNEFGMPKCTVCLEDFQERALVVKLKCKHLFHAFCLQDWLDKILLAPKCPNCNDLILQHQKDDNDAFNSSRVLNATLSTVNNDNLLVVNNNNLALMNRDVEYRDDINTGQQERIKGDGASAQNHDSIMQVSQIDNMNNTNEEEVRITGSNDSSKKEHENNDPISRNNYIQER
jgi:hypothetical protein